MHSELDILDQKLVQLVQLTQRLRAENLQLRQEVAAAVSQTGLRHEGRGVTIPGGTVPRIRRLLLR